MHETYRLHEPEDRNRQEAEIIAKALELRSESRVLDLGCGYGRHVTYLAKMGCGVVGLDLSKYLLAKALEREREYQVQNLLDLIRQDLDSTSMQCIHSSQHLDTSQMRRMR
ncbi:MAG: hypothetical protein DRJ40_05780 [Thermoprotei archaeon]|nr:MAG: hypothetical protein DRJ40_05780 [Thermoprotei archaeon]